MDHALKPATPFTVTQISNLLRKSVEDQFGYVAVKGELSGCKFHTSGHLYFSLKDQDSLLNGICWRGSVSKLPVKPQDGLEVICYGKLTTYGARSQYQMIVETMDVAGAGNLAKLFQERKEKLLAEGLFDQQRKKELPFMPKVIGIVTSETGAVIRDILHRLEDRFPVHVLLWPVAVQGVNAAQEITKAIDGFNQVPDHFPKPDLIIVARGGGSIEDLWAFNEENVVRAVANSHIPIISAVGHETDTTLIDYASDLRAPTPTAAAELAVPVRTDLMAGLLGIRQKLFIALQRHLREQQLHLETLRRGLISPHRFIQDKMQWLDEWQDRVRGTLNKIYIFHHQRLQFLSTRLHGPLLRNRLMENQEKLNQLTRHHGQVFLKIWTLKVQQLETLKGLLDAYSYQRILYKGFAMVTRPDKTTITKAKELHSNESIHLTFADGAVKAVVQ